MDSVIVFLERKRDLLKLIRATATVLVILAAVVGIAASFLLSVLRVDGTSMNPSLIKDDVVLVVHNSAVARGDVVAFSYGGKILIKRVVAVAGEWVDIDGDGIVSIDGVPLREPYVNAPNLGECDLSFPYQVPEGTVFVMGDNRAVSEDSRLSVIGPVEKDQIVGKVVFRLWPFMRIALI